MQWPIIVYLWYVHTHELIIPHKESRSLFHLFLNQLVFCRKSSIVITASLSTLILGDTIWKMMRPKKSSDTIHVFNLMVLCFIALFSSSVLGQGKIRRFRWEVKYEFKSPDCFEKPVITINGKFIGPTIKAQQGDTIVVELKNSFMTENVAVHWHGIRQVCKKSS